MSRFFAYGPRSAALLLAVIIGLPVAAGAPALQTFDARYDVRIKGLRGEMQMALSADGETLTATSTLRARGFASLLARGLIEEYASFAIADLRLVPQEYRSSDTLGSNDSAISMRFDWDAGHADGHEDGTAFEHVAEQHAYDRVTLQYALMLDLLHDRLRDNYVLLDGAERKFLTVTRVGERKIEVPLGTFDTVGISHRSGNSSRITTLWCAPALGFLPVRIEQHRKGKLNVQANLAEYIPATPSVTTSFSDTAVER